MYKNTVKDFNMYNTLARVVSKEKIIYIFFLQLPKQFKKKLRLLDVCVNDPSAGSPTETLLRLLLPLNDKVYSTFQVPTCQTSRQVEDLDPKVSPDHSIGRSDGRCVQRAGT